MLITNKLCHVCFKIRNIIVLKCIFYCKLLRKKKYFSCSREKEGLKKLPNSILIMHLCKTSSSLAIFETDPSLFFFQLNLSNGRMGWLKCGARVSEGIWIRSDLVHLLIKQALSLRPGVGISPRVCVAATAGQVMCQHPFSRPGIHQAMNGPPGVPPTSPLVVCVPYVGGRCAWYDECVCRMWGWGWVCLIWWVCVPYVGEGGGVH